jgi:branched-chain amino acid aminotransferase
MGETPSVWLNGRLIPEGEAHISIFDRGFTLGDGVFETMRVTRGRPPWFADHLARLREGAGVLGIPVPFDDCAIESGLLALIEARGHGQASLRLTLSRGHSQARGVWPPALPMTPTLLATLAPFSAAARPPLKLIVAQTVRRNERSPLSRIKSLNYGDSILARREAESRGADDALLMNGAGAIACATVGNIFLRIGGRWITPPISDGVLAGTARRRLIPLMDAAEASIHPTDLARADAGLISNSLSLSVIGAVDDRDWSDVSDLAVSLALFEA